VAVARVAGLSFGERFCGSPGSANGGYACGSIAELLGGGVEVTLRRPPPLGRPLRLRLRDGGAAAVHDGDELVAEARPAMVALGVAVLGRMATLVLARPRAGTPYCLVAWRDGPADGRKMPAGSALLDGQGSVLAVARAVWVTLP